MGNRDLLGNESAYLIEVCTVEAASRKAYCGLSQVLTYLTYLKVVEVISKPLPAKLLTQHLLVPLAIYVSFIIMIIT